MSAIDDIKAKLDIVQYISQTVSLKKAGRHWKACCPFHSEHSASFMVSAEKQTWHCYGSCASGGDIFTFAQRLHGWTFQEAKEELAKLAGVEIEQPSPGQQAKREALDRLRGLVAAAAESYHNCLLNYDGAADARAYLEKRGLKPETVEKFQIGFIPSARRAMTDNLMKLGYSEDDIVQAGIARRRDDGKVFDFLWNRLIIPIRDERGRPVAFAGRSLDGTEPKYLNTPETPLFSKERLLFGYQREALRETAVIVEGYMDAISAHQAGFYNVVAQMGTALTEHQVKLLRVSRRIVLALDGDNAGQQAARRDLEVAIRSELDVRILTLPDGKDPDDVLRESPGQWPELISKAVPVADHLIEFEASKLPVNASVREREALAKSLLPLLMASESNLYRLDSIQKLALRLRLPDRELMVMAQAPKKPTVVTHKQPPPAAQPKKYSRVEAYCLRAMLQQPDWYSKLVGVFHELELAEQLGPADFPDYNRIIELYKEGLYQDEVNQTDYIHQNIDPSLAHMLDDLGNERLDFDIFLEQALRLRLQRLQAEVEELALIGDVKAMMGRTAQNARIAARMEAIPWKG